MVTNFIFRSATVSSILVTGLIIPSDTKNTTWGLALIAIAGGSTRAHRHTVTSPSGQHFEHGVVRIRLVEVAVRPLDHPQTRVTEPLACTKLLRDRDELVAITLQFRRADPADHEQACLAGRQHGGD